MMLNVKLLKMLENCGLEVRRIINEPTAAQHMVLSLIKNKLFSFHFGGGTFDVSILQLAEGTLKYYQHRNNRLGGMTLMN